MRSLRDSNPWLGSVSRTMASSKERFWTGAGYTGHAMPAATHCGLAVTQMILVKDSAACGCRSTGLRAKINRGGREE